MKTKEKVEQGNGAATILCLWATYQSCDGVDDLWYHTGNLSLNLRSQPEGLRGQSRGSERPIAESGGQLEGLEGPIDCQEGS